MTDKKRLTVEVTTREHQALKAKLAKSGRSISAWLRDCIRALLTGKEGV